MTTLPEVVKHSELLHQMVLNSSSLEELGRIEVIWMYPPAHRVLGFVCKSGFLRNKKLAFKLSQLEAIGSNGILTHSQPDETDAERVRQLESLIQSEVWSNAGNKLGKIVDCVFNLRSGVITDYLIVSDRLSELAGSIYRLPPSKISGFGRKRVLVAETSIQAFVPYREGIQQKISKATSGLKDEYIQVTDDLRDLAKRAQETTQHTTSQLKSLAEQTRERAQVLAEQAKEKVQELNAQLREGAETLVDQAKETGESLVEKIQERTDFLQDNKRDEDDSFRPSSIQAEDWDDEELVEDIEEIFEEIEDLFGAKAAPSAKTSAPSRTPATEDGKSSWQAEEEIPWSRDKLEFWQAQTGESWETEDDDDPWDITELPTPTEAERSQIVLVTPAEAAIVVEPDSPAAELVHAPEPAKPSKTINVKATEVIEADDEPWL